MSYSMAADPHTVAEANTVSKGNPSDMKEVTSPSQAAVVSAVSWIPCMNGAAYNRG